MIDAGLVDEYRLSVYPAVQARGRGLFPTGTTGLQLLGTPQQFPSGIVLLRYRPS